MAQLRVSIARPQEIVTVDRGRIRRIVRTVLRGEGVNDAEISLAFVDKATIRRLNKRYLGHNRPTDVLSFYLTEPGSKKMAGELVIGAQVAQAEAASRGHNVQAELALYIIHGLLHLCGYNDQSAREAKKMRDREKYYLQALGLPNISP